MFSKILVLVHFLIFRCSNSVKCYINRATGFGTNVLKKLKTPRFLSLTNIPKKDAYLNYTFVMYKKKKQINK